MIRLRLAERAGGRREQRQKSVEEYVSYLREVEAAFPGWKLVDDQSGRPRMPDVLVFVAVKTALQLLVAYALVVRPLLAVLITSQAAVSSW